MSRIEYDPIKDRFANIIRNRHFLRTFFYKILDLFFLRSWYIRMLLREYGEELEKSGDWTILDAGCGFGQYDHFILSYFNHVNITSVDVKDDYMTDCRYYFTREIVDGQVTFNIANRLAFDAGTEYDFTIWIDVLEHIEEDEKVISNLYKSLKPGGYFLMQSPSI